VSEAAFGKRFLEGLSMPARSGDEYPWPGEPRAHHPPTTLTWRSSKSTGRFPSARKPPRSTSTRGLCRRLRHTGGLIRTALDHNPADVCCTPGRRLDGGAPAPSKRPARSWSYNIPGRGPGRRDSRCKARRARQVHQEGPVFVVPTTSSSISEAQVILLGPRLDHPADVERGGAVP